MKYSGSRSATVLLLLAMIGVSGHSALGQESNSRPAREPLRVVVYNGDLRALLASLADSYTTVIGFETVPRLPSLVKVEARDVTFRQLLDVIVLGHPQYRWREVDGAIEFTPVSGGSPVLDTVIGSFEVKDVHFFEAADRLLRLPEVQGSLAAMALTRNEEGYKPRTEGNAFSLRLEQVTVRQALNEIARKSGTNFWSFRLFGDKQQFFSLRTSL